MVHTVRQMDDTYSKMYVEKRNITREQRAYLLYLRPRFSGKNRDSNNPHLSCISYLANVEGFCSSVLLHHKELVPHPSSLHPLVGHEAVLLAAPLGQASSPGAASPFPTTAAQDPQDQQQAPRSYCPTLRHVVFFILETDYYFLDVHLALHVLYRGGLESS